MARDGGGDGDRDRDGDPDRDWDLPAAGALLVGVGAASLMGIVTAEFLFPGFDTAAGTISALGETQGPDGSPEPVALLFNGTMVLGGLAVVGAAYFLDRGLAHRPLAALVAASGAGMVGVGLFPTRYGAVHALFALVAFGAGGLSAVVAAAAVRGPFRYLSAAFGVVALAALVAFVGPSGPFDALGVGGVERWIAYPILLWVAAFGGYLLGRTAPDDAVE